MNYISLGVFSGLTLLLLLLLVRIYYMSLPTKRPGRRNLSQTCSLAVFLGSGGHTSEALALVSSLEFSRYYPRTYIISKGDALSAQKVRDLEASKLRSSKPQSNSAPTQYTLLILPRARRVHQSLLATPPTALYSLASCIYHMTILPLMTSGRSTPFAEVLLLNGPGTCVILCLATYISRLLGLPSPRLIYVESFARVQSLSLAGKLLRPLVDRFVVQWPELRRVCPKAEYRGWMV